MKRFKKNKITSVQLFMSQGSKFLSLTGSGDKYSQGCGDILHTFKKLSLSPEIFYLCSIRKNNFFPSHPLLRSPAAATKALVTRLSN